MSVKASVSTIEIKSLSSAAKKIPIEHILASTRNNSGRPGTVSNRAEGPQQRGVNLEEDANKGKDACNC